MILYNLEASFSIGLEFGEREERLYKRGPW